MSVKKKRHPLLLILDIVIVVLTLALAITIVSAVYSMRDRGQYRYSPDNYIHTLQTGDYRSLTQSFYLASYRPILEEEITPELRPYAAVARYYLDRFSLGIYRTMGDTARSQAAESSLEQDRSDMSVFLPEADKIDKIFDSAAR